MANKTPNYGLTKPLPEEFYDVGVHNTNMDIIDSELKNHKHTTEDIGAASMEYVKKVGNPHNLSDNSDFRNPVNQKGKTSYKGAVDCIDRWALSSVAWMVSVEDGYIRVSDNPDSASTATGMLRQYVTVDASLKGKKVTFVAKTKGKDVRLNINNAETGYYSTDESDWVVRSITGVVPSDADSFFVALQFRNATECMCEWVALYEGEYTYAELPEYQPKGYNVELLNCGGITAEFVGARPNTWMPTAEDVGAFVNGGRIIDIDSLDEDGIHETGTESTGTFPSSVNGVNTGVILHKSWDGNYKEQIFMSFGKRQMYHRTMSAGVWKEWNTILNTGNIETLMAEGKVSTLQSAIQITNASLIQSNGAFTGTGKGKLFLTCNNEGVTPTIIIDGNTLNGVKFASGSNNTVEIEFLKSFSVTSNSGSYWLYCNAVFY